MKVLAAAGLAALLAVSLTGCQETSPEGPCKVTDKDRTTVMDADGVSSSIYRVYSSCGVFNVEDAPFLGQFNSADTYSQIEIGKSYEFTTYGFRSGFFSMFPNIVKAVEVN